MTISTSGLPWPLSDKLVAILEEEMERFGIATSVGAILTFRGHDHADGLHTVEIAVGPGGRIEYVSALSCSDGRSHSGPVRELDFDFSLGVFQRQDVRQPLVQVREIFRLWQENFLKHHGRGAYTVSAEPMG